MFTDSTHELIGQDSLLETLNKYTIDTLPHAILLEGAFGCGKHTLCHIVGEKFGLEVVELTSNEDRKDIDEIQLKPFPCLYIIDITNVIPKFQNSILKILEEPPAGAFLFCLCLSKNKVLPTILNRCVAWSFKKYSKAILLPFVTKFDVADREIALNVFDTPGKLLSGLEQPLNKMYVVANDVVNRIGSASIPNVLSISDKMAYKNEKDKFNLDTFVSVLKYCSCQKVVNSLDKYFIKLYNIICEMQSALDLCLSKQRTFEGYLIRLHEVVHDT